MGAGKFDLHGNYLQLTGRNLNAYGLLLSGTNIEATGRTL